jgi:hypothetical protein
MAPVVGTVLLVCGQITSAEPLYQLAVVVSQFPDAGGLPPLLLGSHVKFTAEALVAAKQPSAITANQRQMNVTGEFFGCCRIHDKNAW